MSKARVFREICIIIILIFFVYADTFLMLLEFSPIDIKIGSQFYSRLLHIIILVKFVLDFVCIYYLLIKAEGLIFKIAIIIIFSPKLFFIGFLCWIILTFNSEWNMLDFISMNKFFLEAIKI